MKIPKKEHMLNENRKVLITGGTGSVGLSLIKSFFVAGYSIYFQFIANDEKARQLQSKYKATSFKIDFRGDFDLPNIDFDVIVNNAGINISDVQGHEVTDELLAETLNINLLAPFKICRFYLPAMVKNGWGRLININSIYGMRAAANYLPYNVSKHALTGLTRSLAKDYAIHGVTCNEICPGAIESELLSRIATRGAQMTGSTTKDYLKEVAEEYPGKRVGFPEEISALAVFLASSDASFINGSSIPVDGGLIC
jgi:NAD(P)-dependent dehydrogenase (short-subunit alcohol dehydrogenase family)